MAMEFFNTFAGPPWEIREMPLSAELTASRRST